MYGTSIGSCQKCGTPNSGLSPICIRCGAPLVRSAPTSSTLKWVFSVVAAIALIGAFAVLQVPNQLVKSTGAYQQAIALAQSSAELQNLLGDKITAGFPVVGWLDSGTGSEFTQFSVALAGSRGGGHLYAVANTINGVREFSRLSFVPNHATMKIDLTPAPRLLYLPPIPKKKVYLIPVALQEPLDWAPAYYKAKFGIDVQILPAIELDKALIDSQRQQVDSEQLIEHLGRKFPELAGDPANILIAVTSHDIFIRSFGWHYAENFRHDGRFAVVSSARFRPLSVLNAWNPEWFTSRLLKMLTKNIAILYFDLPMSNDYTSLLSAGALSGREVDRMSGWIIGAEQRWDPFPQSGDFELTMYSVPGKPLLWRMEESHEILPQTSAQVFGADLTIGLFTFRKTDFRFESAFPLKFTRVYRNQDPQSRPFGIGANDSMDIFLVGQMGVYIDLLFEDGARLHFVHVPPAAGQKGDIYQGEDAGGNPFSEARAIFAGTDWTIERRDGWKFHFPYRPRALGANVTVLTGFDDPAGHTYAMVRDASGDLLSVTTPDGQWLHFERNPQHTVRSISASTGRVVTYEYDSGQRLSRVTDSDGYQENYTYDDKAEMLTIAVGSNAPILTNAYNITGDIESQTMADGSKFLYHYIRDPQGRGNALVPDLITTPNGLLTHFQYRSRSYTQSLPLPPPS
jgi:YD repeat-containing protein